MDEGNNIKSFSAADIERYHKGWMPAAEMHALEKAAMDDPFLADAIEGYKIAGEKALPDLNELENRLAERTSRGMLMTMNGGRRFYWLRVAAMVVVVAGAGIFAYTFLNKKENNLASRENTGTEKSKTDSVNTVTPDTISIGSTGDAPTTITSDARSDYLSTKLNGTAVADTVAPAGSENDATAGLYRDSSRAANQSLANTSKDNTGETVSAPSTASPAPAAAGRTDDKGVKKETADFFAYDKKQTERKAAENLRAKNISENETSDAEFKTQNNPGLISANRGNKSNDSTQYNRLNIFRGRVTDASNNAVAFANVNISEVNVGTYTDAGGYFSLVAPDSVLNVNLRAVGFNQARVLLRNDRQSNEVVLQEDKSMDAVVLSTNKPNANRSRTAEIVLTEPEPADGWEKYDNYLVNNRRLPEEKEEMPVKPVQLPQNRAVELSFDINSKGDPVNIRVIKSFSKEYDAEAIRLVKEGPKWKRKNKKGKGTVTVQF
jgi:hypothetical protein